MLIEEAARSGAACNKACELLGITDRTYYPLDVKIVVSKNLFFCCGMIIHFGSQSLLCTWRPVNDKRLRRCRWHSLTDTPGTEFVIIKPND
jgi:hypothetical protein